MKKEIWVHNGKIVDVNKVGTCAKYILASDMPDERKKMTRSPDIQETTNMVTHMEIVEGYLGNKGRFVGDMVHISIKDMADAIIASLASRPTEDTRSWKYFCEMFGINPVNADGWAKKFPNGIRIVP